MLEPHQETSWTTTSSPCAVFATSAKCWIRKGETALWVGLELIDLMINLVFIMVSVSDFGNARWIRWTSFHTLSVILYVGCHFDRRQGLITVLSLAVWQHLYLKGSPPSWVQEDVLWICCFLFAFLKDDLMPCVKWRFMSSWQTFPSKIFKCRMFKAQQRDAFVTEQILFSLCVHVCVDVCSCTLQQSLANQPVVTA